MQPTTQTHEHIEETTKQPLAPQQLFAMNEQLKSIKTVQSGMKTKLNSAISSEEGVAIFDEKLDNLTTEQVDAMTDEEVDAFYNIEGTEVKLLLPSKNDDVTVKEMRRDFIKVLVEQRAAMAELDKASAEFEKEMLVYDAELKELLKEFGDVSEFMRSELVKTIEAATDDVTKARLKKSLESFDDATKLDCIYETYSNLKPSNTIYDYKHRSDMLFAKYNKVIKALGLTFDITTFENLEVNHLDEKYHVYPNLFAFLVIKYGAHVKQPNRAIDGVFFSQLSLNLKMLFNDTFATEEKKKAFIANIERTLDLFI